MEPEHQQQQAEMARSRDLRRQRRADGCSSSSGGDSGDGDNACWICLLEGTPSKPVEFPCACPRGVHPSCLSRWQLQSAGREEETTCRFCKCVLPDWRHVLSPPALLPAPSDPVMAIVYQGQVVRLQVKPGKDGQDDFKRQIRKIFNLPDEVELCVSFDCKAPGTGERLKLHGMESYSAAMYCASVAAGERLAKQSKHEVPAAAAATGPASPVATAAHGHGGPADHPHSHSRRQHAATGPGARPTHQQLQEEVATEAAFAGVGTTPGGGERRKMSAGLLSLFKGIGPRMAATS